MTDRISIPQLHDDEQAALDQLVGQLAVSRGANLLRASYYDGKRGVKQVGSVVPPQYYRLGITLGWSAKAVDLLARRCNVERFVWPAPEGRNRRSSLNSVGADDIWADNNLASELSQAMTSSLIYGPSFLVTTTGNDGEPDALIHAKDALSATGIWNARARRLSAGLSVNAFAEDKPSDFTLYLPNLTIACQRDAGTNSWQVDRHEHTFDVPMEPLVYKPMPGRPWGYSRISRPVMSLHDQALRTVIRMEGHADVYSFPEMWMLGADPSIFRDGQGNQLPDWRVMLGRIKGIPDDPEADPSLARAEVKQFAASSPQPHILQLEQQAMLFAGETSIPVTSLGVQASSGNPTSADSYIASREDLISEAEGATDEWAPGIARAFRRALQVKNGLSEIPPAWRTIQPKFRSPVHVSRASAADAGAKTVAAVPWLAETEVGLELLGLSADQIARALAERPSSDTPTGTPPALAPISGAPTPAAATAAPSTTHP